MNEMSSIAVTGETALTAMATLTPEQDQQAAIKNERQRLADEESARRREDARRAADKAHRGTINRAVMSSLMTHVGLSQDTAKAVTEAIARGTVAHVRIEY